MYSKVERIPLKLKKNEVIRFEHVKNAYKKNWLSYDSNDINHMSIFISPQKRCFIARQSDSQFKMETIWFFEQENSVCRYRGIEATHPHRVRYFAISDCGSIYCFLDTSLFLHSIDENKDPILNELSTIHFSEEDRKLIIKSHEDRYKSNLFSLVFGTQGSILYFCIDSLYYIFDITKPKKPFLIRKVKHPNFGFYCDLCEIHVFPFNEKLVSFNSYDHQGPNCVQIYEVNDEREVRSVTPKETTFEIGGGFKELIVSTQGTYALRMTYENKLEIFEFPDLQRIWKEYDLPQMLQPSEEDGDEVLHWVNCRFLTDTVLYYETDYLGSMLLDLFSDRMCLYNKEDNTISPPYEYLKSLEQQKLMMDIPLDPNKIFQNRRIEIIPLDCLLEIFSYCEFSIFYRKIEPLCRSFFNNEILWKRYYLVHFKLDEVMFNGFKSLKNYEGSGKLDLSKERVVKFYKTCFIRRYVEENDFLFIDNKSLEWRKTTPNRNKKI